MSKRKKERKKAFPGTQERKKERKKEITLILARAQERKKERKKTFPGTQERKKERAQPQLERIAHKLLIAVGLQENSRDRWELGLAQSDLLSSARAYSQGWLAASPPCS